jgi:hypothetical protein
MKADEKFFYMGVQHGISDQCNKYSNMVTNIMAIKNHPCTRVYPAKYLEGYTKGYEDTKGKSWYIVTVANTKIKSYYADGQWLDTKDNATKFPTRAALELVMKKIPSQRGGKCGMTLE